MKAEKLCKYCNRLKLKVEFQFIKLVPIKGKKDCWAIEPVCRNHFEIYEEEEAKE